MELMGVVDYLVAFAIMAGIFSVLNLGLNVHWGFTGLFNIGIAGFFAVGAYTSAILTSASPDPALFEDFVFAGNWAEASGLDWGFDVWYFFALGASALVCGVIAAAIGYVALRLRDDYLAIASLGIAEAIRLIFLNEKWLANGSKGMYNIPKFLGDLVSPDAYNYVYLAVVLVALLVLYLIIQRAVNSPWGRVLRAIREDETAAEASGKDVFSFKMRAFVFGAVIMGVGGAMYAHHVRFLSPLTFDPLFATFVIWAMLMVGGTANNRGAILGAFVVWAIWVATQSLPGVLGDASFRLLLVGALIVAVIMVRPSGILGEQRRIATRQTPADQPPEGGPTGGGGWRSTVKSLAASGWYPLGPGGLRLFPRSQSSRPRCDRK